MEIFFICSVDVDTVSILLFIIYMNEVKKRTGKRRRIRQHTSAWLGITRLLAHLTVWIIQILVSTYTVGNPFRLNIKIHRFRINVCQSISQNSFHNSKRCGFYFLAIPVKQHIGPCHDIKGKNEWMRPNIHLCFGRLKMFWM